jgi:hypothetical protein
MASNTAVLSQPITLLEQDSSSFTKRSVEQWCALCTSFLTWERERILKAKPLPKEQEEHRQTLKWLLRLTRLIHSMAADPEFPDPSAAELLELKLWQLDQSWKMLYEPMPEAEANKILTEVFPNES